MRPSRRSADRRSCWLAQPARQVAPEPPGLVATSSEAEPNSEAGTGLPKAGPHAAFANGGEWLAGASDAAEQLPTVSASISKGRDQAGVGLP